MKKSKSIELNWDDTQKLITLAQEERNPFEIIKKDLGIEEKQVLEIMKKSYLLTNLKFGKRKPMQQSQSQSQLKLMNSMKIWMENII
jgi:hypothetical protein